jgi:hypothetical protein
MQGGRWLLQIPDKFKAQFYIKEIDHWGFLHPESFFGKLDQAIDFKINEGPLRL